MQARADARSKVSLRLTKGFNLRPSRREGAKVKNLFASYLGYQWNDARTSLLGG